MRNLRAENVTDGELRRVELAEQATVFVLTTKLKTRDFNRFFVTTGQEEVRIQLGKVRRRDGRIASGELGTVIA